jgi:hypothetical protein
MPIRTARVAATLVFLCSTTLFAAPATLAPGSVLQVTFTATPNSSDLLFFFDPLPVTVTGSPVVTTQLFDGATLLGTIVAPLFTFSGDQYIQVLFRAPGSAFDPTTNPNATVDFTSIHNGTINGKITMTVSGGTITGFDTGNFFLYDAVSVGGGYLIQAHITRSPVTITGPPPVPTLAEPALAALGLILLAAGAAMIRTRTNASLG